MSPSTIQFRISVIALENMVLGLLSGACGNELAAIEELAEFFSPCTDARPLPLSLHDATQVEHLVERARWFREQPTVDRSTHHRPASAGLPR